MKEPIYVSNSKFGKGVFASRKINKKEIICTLKGKLLKAKELNQITEDGRNILVDPLQIGINKYLHLESPYVYFNHSCNPNAGLINTVQLIALRTIKKNEEIFFDYSTTWYDGMDCHCGSKQCRKHISDYYSIPARTRKKYTKMGIVPDFILKG